MKKQWSILEEEVYEVGGERKTVERGVCKAYGAICEKGTECKYCAKWE